MRILALQLKRIGDLVLSTPALRALRSAWPEAHLTLGVAEGSASLLGAIEPIDSAIVFGRGRGWAPWQQVLTGGWDLCLDFTGTDRSALATALSRARERATFAWVRRRRWRSLAYRRFVESSVRERHTADHYLDLVNATIVGEGKAAQDVDGSPTLRIPASAQAIADDLLRASGITRPFAILHPGTARPEKYWFADRWGQVARALVARHGLQLVITTGPDTGERAHVAQVQAASGVPPPAVLQPLDLLVLAALVERAALVVSCDTGMVHLAAAFRRPQVALYGPVNPFHWRPRHEGAAVISAAQPERPLTEFRPRMKGAPMELVSTEVVIRVTDALLTKKPSPFSESSTSS